jgi:hypothetical protein
VSTLLPQRSRPKPLDACVNRLVLFERCPASVLQQAEKAMTSYLKKASTASSSVTRRAFDLEQNRKQVLLLRKFAPHHPPSRP